MNNAVLRGVRGTQPCFDGAKLGHADFSPNKGVPTCLRGADFSNATLTPMVDLSQADLSPVNPDDLTTASQFLGAKMNGVALSLAKLSGAVFTGVELHDANLSNSTLSGADLTGAQLGAFSELFRVGSTSSDYKPFFDALQALNAKGVSVVFNQNHYPISPDGSTVANQVPERSWTVTDNTSQTRYLVLKSSTKDGSTSLIVASPVKAASLAGAYMPNAKFVGANLLGVNASNAQMYHTANTDPGMGDALLDGINLANANLGTLDLTDAKLYGAVMTNANLINAKLNRAILANASLDYTNLAGADFTDATLDHASLTNAAVSTKLNSNTSGVHLFSLPMSDTNFSGALAEVQAAATKQITLSTKLDKDNPDGDPKYQSYVDALNDGKFAPLCVIFQKMGVEFSQGANPRHPHQRRRLGDHRPSSAQSGRQLHDLARL